MVAATARARERERARESQKATRRMHESTYDVLSALFVHVVSEHCQRHTCMCVRSNGVRGDAERSFEFGSSDQRNKEAIHSQQWPVGGGVRLDSGPGDAGEPRGRLLFYRVAVYTLPTPRLPFSRLRARLPARFRAGSSSGYVGFAHLPHTRRLASPVRGRGSASSLCHSGMPTIT